MARPLRTRRTPLKYSEDENIVGLKSRNSKKKITTEANSDNKEGLNNAKKSLTTITKSEKGILIAGKNTSTQIPRSPVLRDRTNLPAEPLKVDILVKKGADDKTTEKTTKAMRETGKRMANEDAESEAPTRAKRGRPAKGKDSRAAVETIENLWLRKEKSREAEGQKENSEKSEAEKKNTRKAVAEKEKPPKALEEKEKTGKVEAKKKNTPRSVVEKENTAKDATEKDSAQKVVGKKGKGRENTRKAVTEKETVDKIESEKEDSETASPVKDSTENESAEKEILQEGRMVKEMGTNGPIKAKAKAKGNWKKVKVIKDASTSKNEDDSLVVESEDAGDSKTTPKVKSARAVTRKIVKTVGFSKVSLSQQSNRSIENRSKKSLRRSSEVRKREKDEATTSGVAGGRKFFKSKGVSGEKNLAGKKIATSKRRKVERPRVSTSFRLRQTTLSESFAKQATKKNLRPRVAQKNYHESTIAEKTSATDTDVTKGPIYKSAKFLDKSDECGSEIYDFHFDSNDFSEKVAIKKKKRVMRNVMKKRAKASNTKKTIAKAKVATKIVVKKNEAQNIPTINPSTHDEPMNTNDAPAIVINDCVMSPIPGPSENVKTQPKRLEPQAERVESHKNKPKVMKSLDLTEEMKINLTSTPQLTKTTDKNVRALRTTNAFNIPRPSGQYRTMINHALLNKSLSPIKKALENFDPGSPWRPPVITGLQFSHVKNVFQSTPQVRQFSMMLQNHKKSLESKADVAVGQMNKITENEEKNRKVEEKNTKATEKMNKIGENDEKKTNVEPMNIKATEKINKIGENDENSENVKQANIKASAKLNKIGENNEKTTEQINIKPMPQKILGLAKSPRKFGTVISNVNVAIPSVNPLGIHENNDKSELNRGSPRKNSIVDSPGIAEFSDNRISDGNDFNDYADKENSIPALTSPKKAQKSPKKLVAKQSPLKAFNQAKIATKENWEPQPGPSGLQKRSPLGESRILRQSNLNNFLNIEEAPSSTRISTAHGIFSDAHSTPIPGKPVKVINTEPNVENAFGFDDVGEWDPELSPIKSNLFAEPSAAKVAKKILERRKKIEAPESVVVPSRFSIGEIKKHLRPVVSKGHDKADPVESTEKNDNRAKRGGENVENDKDKDDTFSDTFDILIAAETANDKDNVQEVPLFADLEPVHFKQPPRHSYKRKRNVAFNFSEDEEDNEDDEYHCRLDNTGTKKRKVSKVEKQRQKQMEEWAKGLNNTFEEIDHFDLVVEKQ